MKAATTVSATAATAITPKITFSASGTRPSYTITYTNTSGKSTTSGANPASVTIKYNTAITIKNTNDYIRYVLSITQGSTYKAEIIKGMTWTSGKLTANTSFKLVSEWVSGEGSGGEGSGGEGGA